MQASKPFDLVADVGVRVEPGAGHAGGAGDRVEGDRRAVAVQAAQRLDGSLTGLFAATPCGGA
jgi:hypothetical protein